jgi:hypothetical protein
MWQDKRVQAEFKTKAQARFQEIQAELEGETGVVAI